MTRTGFPHLPAEAWELYLDDELRGASLRSVEEHLDGCEDCRAVLEHRDPSRLFRRLRDLPVREQALEGLWDAVRAEIGAPAARPAPAQRRERLGLLAGAATLLLSLVLFQSVGPGTAPHRTALFQADDCTRLALTSEECRGLFVDVRFDSEPPLLVDAAADLAELL